jgi:hypothetical protein
MENKGGSLAVRSESVSVFLQVRNPLVFAEVLKYDLRLRLSSTALLVKFVFVVSVEMDTAFELDTMHKPPPLTMSLQPFVETEYIAQVELGESRRDTGYSDNLLFLSTIKEKAGRSEPAFSN